jgi:actin-related protein 10
MRVPQEVLTDAVVEEIKTRCCFVGDGLETSIDSREDTPAGDDGSEFDIPPSSDITQSDSDVSHTGRDSNMSSQHESSEFAIISTPRGSSAESSQGESHLQALATMYTRHSTATDLQMRVTPPPSQQTGTGRGTLIIPGWVRERASEVLFEGGDVDESSLAEVILDSLLKVCTVLMTTPILSSKPVPLVRSLSIFGKR